MDPLDPHYRTPDGCYELFTSRLYALNSCVVATEDLVLVVDPGYLPDEVAAIRNHVEAIRAGRPLYLLLTHSDSDHIAGYGAFADATVIASRAFAEHPDTTAAVEEVMAIDDDYYIDRPYPVIYPPIDLVIDQEGQRLTVGATTIRFYSGIGHNRDGLIAYIESERLLLTGDYLSDLEFPFVTASYSGYRQTLATLARLIAEEQGLTLIPCHGAATDDPAELSRRLRLSHEYIALVADLVAGKAEPAAYERFLDAYSLRFRRFLRQQHEGNLALYRSETATS
ncbi:hypothetical protein PA598K_03379 [Paenibacillus sp. 598K]|uniref:MBL fold metallo-hydrolase n=1 Tax=Paenibacillus sp. 598K TaxID=1117987 RepID=UPI000FF91745|nr:MBL fold metallo-hydrolase [Paenibacillus sp. 598K]GBF75004.1 hypothetical protein PA598K_03379 [Paenibacillus sp. 598K]